MQRSFSQDIHSYYMYPMLNYVRSGVFYRPECHLQFNRLSGQQNTHLIENLFCLKQIQTMIK